MNLLILYNRVNLEALAYGTVSYQAAQLYHLQHIEGINITWQDELSWFATLSETERQNSKKFDAIIVVDELHLLMDPISQRVKWDTNATFVFVTHDYWCHPVWVASYLRQLRNPLVVLRHYSAMKLYQHLLPETSIIYQRPGVETSIFYPHSVEKEYDIILGGSDTPDYPVRTRLNNLVRRCKDERNWKVLDLANSSLMSNPIGNQKDWALALSKSKISPTGSNRGGGKGAKLVIQYIDNSDARAQYDHPFYGLVNPDVSTFEFDTAGVTPRYVESMATKTLLLADLPKADYQKWYEDKMVIIKPDMSDETIADHIDLWLRFDDNREKWCKRTHQSVMQTETSQHKAEELINLISSHHHSIINRV